MRLTTPRGNDVQLPNVLNIFPGGIFRDFSELFSQIAFCSTIPTPKIFSFLKHDLTPHTTFPSRIKKTKIIHLRLHLYTLLPHSLLSTLKTRYPTVHIPSHPNLGILKTSSNLSKALDNYRAPTS